MYPPDDCAECPRRQVKVLGLREAGWGNVGRQPDVPVQVEHGDVVARLRLDLSLVEAHDVLVERVPDDVGREVRVRRELLLQQLVVLAQNDLKLWSIIHLQRRVAIVHIFPTIHPILFITL